MHSFRPLIAALLLALSQSLALPVQAAASANDAAPGKVVAEATGGKFKATRGQYFEPTCNAPLDYDAEVIDLNGDGQPEVFTNVHGSCLGGMAAVHMDLLIKGSNGRWTSQFGFPGMYTVLKTKNKGFPDIEIGGPGNCFPVWRWNGRQYALHKKCN